MDKRHVYDWNTHIHLLVRGPSIVPGQIVKAPITNVDFAPTFVDLACDDCCDKRTGLCIGGASNASSNTLAPFDGRSILPLLSNENLVDSWRDEVFIEYYYNDPNVKCVENCNPKAGQYPKRTSHLSVVSKRNRQHIRIHRRLGMHRIEYDTQYRVLGRIHLQRNLLSNGKSHEQFSCDSSIRRSGNSIRRIRSRKSE